MSGRQKVKVEFHSTHAGVLLIPVLWVPVLSTEQFFLFQILPSHTHTHTHTYIHAVFTSMYTHMHMSIWILILRVAVCVHVLPPSWASLSPFPSHPLGHHRAPLAPCAPGQLTSHPGALCSGAAPLSPWRPVLRGSSPLLCVLHRVVYVHHCPSPSSCHPLLPCCVHEIILYVSPFLPCTWVHLQHFSRFHICALICNICVSLSDFTSPGSTSLQTPCYLNWWEEEWKVGHLSDTQS